MIILRNVTFDTMDYLQVNGAPGGTFELSGITVKNHLDNEVFVMKTGKLSKARPTGLVKDVEASGAELVRFLSESFSTVKTVDCTLNDRPVSP